MLNNKILVIDDEVIVIESILEDLNGMGFKFISAANGKDGLAKYEEEEPILVILDLRMPGMNGVEFLENLGIRLNDQCTVIVLTGHGDEDDIKKCFDLGISSFIRKPYNIDVLRGTIRHAIKLKQVQQELIDAINERRKMEEVLLQSEKLKSIGTITAGISHEFNNILAIISGNIELLTETYKDHIELTDVLRTIGKAVKDGAEISRNMLKFTKTKQDTKEFVSSDIRDLIMQSLEFTMPRWKNMAQIEGLNYQIDKEGMKEVSSIMCNPTEIREVFINIINNAFDAMSEGGSLSFSTWDRDEVVFVKITDSGDGMPEDVKKNIFDPFFTTKTPVGTGLGMSTAYGTVSRHGGRIEVESEVGKGSTFTLQFP
ncbi:MAG: response regulator, partial [Gammaproteobacteria bacterium]|nr:response regulator [Gammaproteobacteria bacterium]